MTPASSPLRFEVLVAGAGPAGLAAACSAARGGRRVAVLDDNPHAGGQIWREALGQSPRDRRRDRVIEAFLASGAELFPGRQVIDGSPAGILHTWHAAAHRLESFAFDKLVLATGARERFLPFPGWTLPGVFGAGGLQALVRGGFSVRGKRVVVAGTGPLLLAVAAHLQQDGAEIVCIAEQASLPSLARFAASLLKRPGKILQGIQLRAELSQVAYRTGCWPVAAEGHDALTSLRLTDGTTQWSESCDLLACGFHLVPNTELASLLGCGVDERGVIVDEDQLTTVPGIYCAGEPTGIAGLDAALLQGEVAGLSASGNAGAAARLHARRDTELAFGRAMGRAFALRKQLRTLATPETILCRCEDVRYRDLAPLRLSPHSSWTDAKLQTRCGMGPCQGRICGPALETLFGWRNTSVRPPLFPVPIAALCSTAQGQEDFRTFTQELSR
jgi:NADPH-dependent 2,4-dienoyl-CoA reductase/sulfur reductase-like enzyme